MLDIENESEFQSDKIIPFDQVEKKINDLKKQDLIVGLCHGGFDLLHPGHMRHFESAKKLCDVLFVSITTDTFVSQRKNTGRPVFPENLRAYAVASLTTVDYVFICDYKQAAEVIRKIKPSYYIKGPDYVKKNTPGIQKEREAIESIGGKMQYTNDLALSTTRIIDYIKTCIERQKILVLIDRDGTLIQEADFLGKHENWMEEVSFNKPVIQFLSYIQTKENTTNIVLSNQAGVARGYYDCRRVDDINSYIDTFLTDSGITIHNWQYCPDVDATYAKQSEFQFKKKYIKEKTKRKPELEMLHDALNQLHMNIKDFHHILVLGDRHEDEGLADKIKAQFIDVREKKYTEMINEYELNRKK